MADSDETPSGTAGGAVGYTLETVKWLWDNRTWVNTQFAAMRDYFWPKDGEQRRVLIIGPGGVGKSTVGALIAGHQHSLLELPGQYTESFDPETQTLQDDESVGLLIAPGQEHRRDLFWTEIESDIAKGAYHGIIIVSSFGYHSLGELSYKNHRLYRGDTDKFLADYLKARRDDECAVLDRLAPFIQASPNPLWLATLVTKQDLWFDAQGSVEAHYKDGSYGTLLSSISRKRGAANFRHEYVFASLILANFRTGYGEVLASTVAGYDQPQQVASAKRLVETLYALMKWDKRA